MTAAGRVAFVTHGGAAIGLGHVKRCLALARALAAEGTPVSFVVSPEPTVARSIQAAGFPVAQCAWEPAPAALGAAMAALDADTGVVDAYPAGAEHWSALRRVTGRLVAIDDTAERRLPVDVIINVGAGTEELEDAYDALVHTRLLLGSRFALLDPAYGAEPVRPGRARVERVLVTLGGSVHADALRAVVAAVDAALDGVQIDVVAGPFGSPGAGVNAARSGRNTVMDHGAVPELRPLMLAADLAVTGAGVTLSELAATATPAVMVLTGSNQARNVAAFEKAAGAVPAGPATGADLGRRVQDAVTRLAGDGALRARLGARGRALVDGQGAKRVARELMSLAGARR